MMKHDFKLTLSEMEKLNEGGVTGTPYERWAQENRETIEFALRFTEQALNGEGFKGLPSIWSAGSKFRKGKSVYYLEFETIEQREVVTKLIKHTAMINKLAEEVRV